MATFTTSTRPIRLEEPGFFAKPISRWLSMLALVLSIGLCGWVISLTPSFEQVIKAVLFTVPATAYLLYRSFVRQA